MIWEIVRWSILNNAAAPFGGICRCCICLSDGVLHLTGCGAFRESILQACSGITDAKPIVALRMEYVHALGLVTVI